MFDSLGELLIQIQLLREEQWQKVRLQFTPDAHLRTVLDLLQKLPAWWADDPSVAALTDYQRKWIKRLFGKRRLSRLEWALSRGDYLILDELGEGGMGVVYKAWDFQHSRFVAVKQIKKVSLETYRRFRREARIQTRLSHPLVVRCYEFARIKGETLLVQEYIEGRTIAEEVKARGPIPWQEAARWTLNVLAVLEHAHRLKIIHRDLKPSNIILHQQPSGLAAKVLDLGLAKCLDPTSLAETTTKDVVTIGDALLGTFEYMAPEQWRGSEATVPASDIYSLGCSFYFALTGGRPPFQANSMVAYCNAHTNTPPPSLAEAQPSVPEALDALVQQMLAKEPAKRGTPARLIKQFRKLLRVHDPDQELRSAKTPTSDSQTSLPSPHRHTDPSAQTPVPNNPLALQGLQSPPVDQRFMPFDPASDVKVYGVWSVLRALLVSQGLWRRVLFSIVVAVTVLILLWILFFSPSGN